MVKTKSNMKHAVIVIFISLFAFSCASDILPPPVTNSAYFNSKMTKLANDLMKNSSKKVRRAAVLDFVNSNGRTSQLGKYVKTKFSEIAVLKSLFQMPVDGQVTDSIAELNLDYRGTLNKDSAGKLGRALGVDSLIIGQISDLQKGSDVDLTIRMVEVRTGNIISAASTSFHRSKNVSSMLESF